MTYSSTPQGENTYLVKLDTGETFICVVAASPDELDGLVADHLRHISAPVSYSAPDPKIAIQSKIAELESASMLPRVTREFMLVYMESQATPAQLASLPAYVKVKALDTEIAALRSQLL